MPYKETVPAFMPASKVGVDLLVERVEVAMTMPHYDHAGLPGHPVDRCPRCNAERALEELKRRLEQTQRELEREKAGWSAADDLG